MNRIGESMHETVWALMKRVEALESRCARLEAGASAAGAAAPEPDARTAGLIAHDDLSQKVAVMHALNEYSRRQRLEELRERPESLAAIRADRAARSAFQLERGLPPMPDAYPELP
jgi:hypothetical protein